MGDRGIVVAGSEHTAQAGVAVLRDGGNAVDALLAALLTTPLAEPGLSSFGGGGVMQVLSAGALVPEVFDFFANGPGLGGDVPDERDFFHVDLNFGPAVQRFHMGRASAAVPGFLPGVLNAHQRWGKMPFADVVAPAATLAHEGVRLNDYQAFACGFHRPMLSHSVGLKQIFAPGGKFVTAGDMVFNPALAVTLEGLGRQGQVFYADELVPAMLADFGTGNGGMLTGQDLERYTPEVRRPIELTYRGRDVFLNPPPAAGGTLIALALHLLATLNADRMQWGTRAHLMALIAAMRVIEESRTVDGSPLADLDRWRRRFAQLQGETGASTPAMPGPGHTTHVSVIDGEGTAAAATVSYGQGAGYLVGETGIPMNNLMGEEDLHPRGFHSWPAGTRLGTNMSPTIVRGSDGSLAVLGSGGSNRIRTAILQVICNLADFQMTAEEAVGHSRVHYEGGVINAEIYDRPEAAALLNSLAGVDETFVSFDAPNMFFGGVHLAQRTADGCTGGAGDPRRCGVAIKA